MLTRSPPCVWPASSHAVSAQRTIPRPMQVLPEEAIGIHLGRPHGRRQRMHRPPPCPLLAIGDRPPLQGNRDRLGDQQVVVARLHVERACVVRRLRAVGQVLDPPAATARRGVGQHQLLSPDPLGGITGRAGRHRGLLHRPFPARPEGARVVQDAAHDTVRAAHVGYR